MGIIKLSEKAFQDLFETAKIAKFTKSELLDYEEKMKQWNDSKAIMDYAVATGIEKGREEGIGIGIEKGRTEVFSLLEQGLSLAEAKKKLGLEN